MRFSFAGCAASAQPRKTVFLITDAEGVAGVCRQDQTDPKIRKCASSLPAKSTPRSTASMMAVLTM
jgi:hypothetical protein